MTFRCNGCHGVVGLPEEAEAQGRSRCKGCGQAFTLGRLQRAGEGLVLEARQLAVSNGIDLPAAYSVAMGLMTLDDVRQRLSACARAGAERRTTQRSSDKPARLPFLLISCIVVAAGALAWVATRNPARTPASFEPSRSSIGSAEVLTDPHGQVVQVSAPDPRSVLAAYCRAGSEPGRYRLVDVVPSQREPGRERIGLLEDPGGASGLLALTIREDRARELWIAGDGLAPLRPNAAPPWVTSER